MRTSYNINDEFISARGTKIKLIKRIKSNRWEVEVSNSGYTIEVAQSLLKESKFLTPLCRTVYSVGYLGFGRYTVRTSEGKISPAYSVWSNIIRRCYTDYSTNKSTESYAGVKVEDQWHSYQVFAEWYESHSERFFINGITPKVDKDLIGTGKLYSENTCVLLPNNVNCILADSRVTSSFSHGVRFICGKYFSEIMLNGKHTPLGSYDNPLDATLAYKRAKQKHLKVMAERYKQCLSEKAYNALYNWGEK